MNINKAKTLMTAAAEATLRGDVDAVAKATDALAELERSRSERNPPIKGDAATEAHAALADRGST